VIEISVASAHDLPWIYALELRHYGPMHGVAAARLREWYAANPLGFLVARDGGERCAHVTLLPLKPPFLRALMAGAKSENDIRAADLGFERSPRSPYYVAKYEELVRRTTELRSRLGALKRAGNGVTNENTSSGC
jgi:hypothetical protein